MGLHSLNDKLAGRLRSFFSLFGSAKFEPSGCQVLGREGRDRLALLLPPWALVSAEVWVTSTDFEFSLCLSSSLRCCCY